MQAKIHKSTRVYMGGFFFLEIYLLSFARSLGFLKFFLLFLKIFKIASSVGENGGI